MFGKKTLPDTSSNQSIDFDQSLFEIVSSEASSSLIDEVAGLVASTGSAATALVVSGTTAGVSILVTNNSVFALENVFENMNGSTKSMM